METISGVGLSRKWDSTEAGKEVATDLLRNLGGEYPECVLLFSTIHYKDNGGFQKLLDSIYEVLPKNTSLVGGTTAGFVIPQGCFTRGVAAFGLKSKKVDFSIAIAQNMKRNPVLAARQCALKVKTDLSKSNFKNKFLLNLPAGITTPKIPGFPDNLRVIRIKGFSKIISSLLILFTKFSLLVFQKGPGREDEIIKTLASELPEYRMIGGSFVDDNKGYFNFQFYNQKVYTNALITLAMATDFGISVQSNFGLVESSQKFNITKTSLYGLVIDEINGKSAFSEIIKILGWPKDFMEDSRRILRRTFYIPIGYNDGGKKYVSVIAFIFGDSIVISPKVHCAEACFMTTSGEKLIQVVDSNLLETKEKDIQFGIISSCIARLETLGSSVYKVHEKLIKHFKGKPFIQMYAVGEDVYTPELGAKRISESYNTAIFYDEKDKTT